jgi:hypothetical protein
MSLASGTPAKVLIDRKWIEGTTRAIVRDERTRFLAVPLINLPGYAVATATALAELYAPRHILPLAHDLLPAPPVDPGTMQALLVHPYWRIRLVAAAHVKSIEERVRTTCSVWASITEAQLPISDEPRIDLVFFQQDELDAAKQTPQGWGRLAERCGGLMPMPPLPSLEEGMKSPCADLAAWCTQAVGRMPESVPPRLVLSAAELDALREQEKEDVAAVAVDSAGFGAWLEENRDRIED